MDLTICSGQNYLQADTPKVLWDTKPQKTRSELWDTDSLPHASKRGSEYAKEVQIYRHEPTNKPIFILGKEIPESLRSLANEIEKSSWMLELKDDWDGEGSPGYSSKTRERAISFLLENALTLWNQKRVVIETPNIHNGPEGSIDLYWDASDIKLLINIPSHEEGKITFYAYNTKGDDLKGSLSPSSDHSWLLSWQKG